MKKQSVRDRRDDSVTVVPFQWTRAVGTTNIAPPTIKLYDTDFVQEECGRLGKHQCALSFLDKERRKIIIVVKRTINGDSVDARIEMNACAIDTAYDVAEVLYALLAYAHTYGINNALMKGRADPNTRTVIVPTLRWVDRGFASPRQLVYEVGYTGNRHGVATLVHEANKSITLGVSDNKQVAAVTLFARSALARFVAGGIYQELRRHRP